MCVFVKKATKLCKIAGLFEIVEVRFITAHNIQMEIEIATNPEIRAKK